MTLIYLAVEDELSEVVGKRIVRETLGDSIAVHVLRKNGFGYLKSKLKNFAEMSKQYAVLMITDLDTEECAPTLKTKCFQGIKQPENFIFRVAVREVEAWLLADPIRLSQFLGVKPALFPRDPEILNDPKAALVNIAKRARREVRLDIVPEDGASTKQGLGYNRALCPFVERDWNIRDAAENSESLKRACQRVAELAD